MRVCFYMYFKNRIFEENFINRVLPINRAKERKNEKLTIIEQQWCVRNAKCFQENELTFLKFRWF